MDDVYGIIWALTTGMTAQFVMFFLTIFGLLGVMFYGLRNFDK